MIVGRLAAAARAVINEFEETGILALLDHASAIATSRGHTSDAKYQIEVSAIREAAQFIVNRHALKGVSKDIERILDTGRSGNFTPEGLARILLSSVNLDKNSSMSSSEMTFYRDSAASFVQSLNAMLKTFEDLELDTFYVQDGTVAFDFYVPRTAFDNKTSKFISINSAFNDLAGYVQEISGGPTDGTTLVYTSTSDPVTAVAVVSIAAMPILLVYEKLLDIAKKQIDIFKSLSALRGLFKGKELPDEFTAHEAVKEMARAEIEDAVNEVAQLTNSNINDGRKREITNAIMMKSSVLVTAIANGARVSIAIESQISMPEIFENDAITYEKIRELMTHVRPLENSVSEGLRMLNQNVPLLDAPAGDAPTA